MGMFDWLLGKKAAGQSGSVATPPPPPGSTPTAPARPVNLVDALLQRCKELPPNDTAGAATLLREMVQASAVLAAGAGRGQELNEALDSMARHYPDALQGLANGQNEIPVRLRAVQVLAQRRDLRALRPALDLARTPAADQMVPLLRTLLDSNTEHLSPEDLAVLSSLGNQEKVDFSAVRDLAGRELRRREERNNPQVRMRENLQRWREQAARSWVEARRGEWNHQDWVDLLASLERSDYWPLAPEDIGHVLEDLKREYLARRQG